MRRTPWMVVLGAVVALVASAGAGAGRAGASGATAAQSDGTCADPDGVTVVVDFQQLGGGVHVRCAPSPVGTGFDALTRAGIVFQTTTRSPGFLCRIAGQPANDPCIVPSPATAYWSYWLAERGGQWCYSNLGAGNRPAPPGTVEGWSFSMGSDGSSAAPPRYAVPAAIPGAPARPLGAGDCDASVPAPAPSPPAVQGDGGGAAPDVAPPADPGTGAAPGPAPDSGIAAGADDVVVGGAAPTSSTTTVGGDAATTTSTGPDGVVGTPAAPATGSTARADGEDNRAESGEAGTMDLSGDGRDDGGSPLGVVVAITLIGAVGAGAVVIRRRAARD